MCIRDRRTLPCEKSANPEPERHPTRDLAEPRQGRQPRPDRGPEPQGGRVPTADGREATASIAR
eukprot:4462115-Alexandrium_andersonii.AAC.1